MAFGDWVAKQFGKRESVSSQPSDSRLTKEKARRFHVFGARDFFDMGAGDRLQSDWPTAVSTQNNADRGIRQDIEIIRSRARKLVANDGYARRFLSLAQHNVVGAEGFRFQSKVVEPAAGGGLKPDYLANRMIEEAFADWANRKNCMVDGAMSFRALQLASVAGLARDGEVFIRMYVLGKYGLQLQVIEPELIDAQLNMVAPNGNRISMGVELNEFGRPVAYHVKELDNNIDLQSVRRHVRIPADAIIHLFVKERATQSRGVSWLAPIGVRMWQLSQYEAAALVNARIGASKMGFLYTETGAEQYTGDGTDAAGNTLSDVAAGTIERLPDGLKFQGFNPDYPTQQYETYVRSILRGVSAGLGVSYNSLAHDLASVNYSSIRAGVLEERETWKSLQALIIENMLEPIFEQWIANALLSGQLRLPASKVEKFTKPSFIGRRWPWVDPLNDVQANVVAVQNRFKTQTDVLAEQGKDFEETLQQIQQEQQIANDLGVTIASALSPVTASGSNQSGSAGQ